jgi:hypothetical protein
VIQGLVHPAQAVVTPTVQVVVAEGKALAGGPQARRRVQAAPAARVAPTLVRVLVRLNVQALRARLSQPTRWRQRLLPSTRPICIGQTTWLREGQ